MDSGFKISSRRRFLGSGSRLVAAALAWGVGGPEIRRAAAELAGGARARLFAAQLGGPLLSYLADLSGNGRFDEQDESIVRAALGSRRGPGLLSRAGYDFRADVFGRAAVDQSDLEAVLAAIEYFSNNPEEIVPRPVTVAWHYGWYNNARRRVVEHTAWFLGGGYSSRSPETEALFNDLKNELGITVDALAWADPKRNRHMNRNLELGYMAAENGRTRHAALLYESQISLGMEPGERVDFEQSIIRERVIAHFRGMGRTMRLLRDEAKARVFRMDGKPVVFIYASHTWGTNPDGIGVQYDRINETIENARNAFAKVYGSEPFLVGEEIPFDLSDQFDGGRWRRSNNFDAIFSYHHAASPAFVLQGGQRLGSRYAKQVKAVLRRSYAGAGVLRNRFTGKRPLVIPSLAAGFAKPGLPTLFADRGDYADFLKDIFQFHQREYLWPVFGRERRREIAPIVTVGSWNEEFEGHAVFPAEFNDSLASLVQNGFDYGLAIKQVFGWNH